MGKIDVTIFTKRFIPLAVVVTAVAGFAYVAVQQNYRMSANDPQIQIAHDAADVLNGDAAPASVLPKPVDLGQSLAPFVIVFDNNHNVLASSGQLGGSVPTPPAGTFDYAQSHGENRFTWQPQANVREAAILVRSNNGYVLAARSLREVEAREDRLTAMAAATLAVALVGTAALAYLSRVQ